MASPLRSVAAMKSPAKRLKSLRPFVLGQEFSAFTSNPGAFWRHLTGDSQLRWLGPERGVIHLATAAIVNALWDLYSKRERKPLWRLLCDLTPEQLVACIDFRYLTDAVDSWIPPDRWQESEKGGRYSIWFAGSHLAALAPEKQHPAHHVM